MFWQRRYLLIAVGLVVLAFILGYSLAGNKLGQPPGEAAKPLVSSVDTSQPATGFRVSAETKLLVEEEYTGCQHTVTTPLPLDLEWLGKDLDELDGLFPAATGWKRQLEGENTVRLYRRLEGLCPADDRKRHLSELNGYLAIYKGPSSSSGGLVSVTNTPVASLPPEIQARIRNKTMDFANEEELMQALDSFDEFVE